MSGKDEGVGEVGAEWRLLAHKRDGQFEVQNEGVFDELVVDDWLHIEQLEGRFWWIRIGDARVRVEIPPNGQPTVDVERGAYAEVKGACTVYQPPDA